MRGCGSGLIQEAGVSSGRGGGLFPLTIQSPESTGELFPGGRINQL